MNIDKNSYFIIYSWMSTELNLKGSELNIFALIYSFTVNAKNFTDEAGFYGSQDYISNWFKISKPTIIKCLDNLVEKSYITKTIGQREGFITHYIYRANLELLKQLNCITD